MILKSSPSTQPLVNIRRSTASAAQISHHISFTAGGIAGFHYWIFSLSTPPNWIFSHTEYQICSLEAQLRRSPVFRFRLICYGHQICWFLFGDYFTLLTIISYLPDAVYCFLWNTEGPVKLVYMILFYFVAYCAFYGFIILLDPKRFFFHHRCWIRLLLTVTHCAHIMHATSITVILSFLDFFVKSSLLACKLTFLPLSFYS